MLSLSTRCVLSVEECGEHPSVSKLAFHPSRPVIATAVGNRVTVDDFTSGTPVQRGVVHLRSTVQQVALSSSYLAASDEAGSIYVWDFFNLQLVTDLTHTQQEEKPLGKILLAPELPILMYTRTNSKAVYVQEIGMLHNLKPQSRLDCKRTISGVCLHPTETLAAVYCNGVVIVYDYVSGAQVCQSDELLRSNQTAAGKGWLSFGGNGMHLAVASERGMLACFNFEQRQLTRVGLSKTSSPDAVVGVHFHPTCPVFYVLSAGGLLVPRNTSCEVAKTCAVELVPEMEKVARIPELVRLNNTAPSPLVVNGFQIHPSLGVFAFTFTSESHANVEPQVLSRHILYALVDRNEPNIGSPDALAGLPSRQETLGRFIGDDKQCCASLYYIEGASILKRGLHTGISSAFCSLPTVTSTGVPLHPLQLSYTEGGLVARFQTVEPVDTNETNSFEHVTKGYFAIVDRHGDAEVPEVLPGASVAPRFGSKESQPPFVLTQDRTSVGIVGDRAFQKLPEPARAIFTASSLGSIERILVWVEGKLVLAEAPFKVFTNTRLRLEPWESVCGVAWNLVHVGVNEHNYVCAVMTTHRIVIVDECLEIVTEVWGGERHPFVRNFSSMFWLGAALLFTAGTTVSALTISGGVHPLCEVSTQDSAIVGVWGDRLLLAYLKTSSLTVHTLAIGVLEPLLLGELAACDLFGRSQKLNRQHVGKLLARYDSKRISSALLSGLEMGGYYDIALALSLDSPLVALKRKFYQALYARKFDTAKQLLDTMRSSDCPAPTEVSGNGLEMLQANAASEPPSASLSKLYCVLAAAAGKYGQFSLAVKCYAEAENYVDMLPLLACVSNRGVIEAVLKQLQNKPDLADVTATCKRLLKSKALTETASDLPTFQFVRAHPPLTTTPTTVACLSAGKTAIPSLEFQDSLARWFPVIIDNEVDHEFLHRETEFEVTDENRGIPSNLRDIVPLLITRLAEAKAFLEQTNFLKEKPRSLAPPPPKRLLVRREGYSLASSSLLRGSGRGNPSAEATDVTTVTYNSDDESADIEHSQISKARIVAPNRDTSGLPGDSDTNDMDGDSDSAEFLSDEEVLDGPPPIEELARSPSLALPSGEAGDVGVAGSGSDSEEFVSEEIISETEDDDVPAMETRDEGEASDTAQEESPSAEDEDEAALKRTTSSGLIPPKQLKRVEGREGASLISTEDSAADPLLEPPCDDDFTRQRSPSEGGNKPQLLVAASTPTLANSSLPPRPPRNRSATNLGVCSLEGDTRKSPRGKIPKARQWTNVRSSVSSAAQLKAGGSAKSLVTRAHSALQKCIDALVVGRFSTAQVRAEQASAILSSANAANYRSEVKLCAAYRQASRLLQRVKLLDHAGVGAEGEVAFLCSILASLPVAPVHRLAFTAIAAEKNFLAQNYGVATDFLKLLQKRNLLNKAQVDQMIADCELLGCNDLHEYEAAAVRCCTTFEKISGTHAYCTFCNSSFCFETGRPGDNCWMCSAGVLEVRDTPSRFWTSK